MEKWGGATRGCCGSAPILHLTVGERLLAPSIIGSFPTSRSLSSPLLKSRLHIMDPIDKIWLAIMNATTHVKPEDFKAPRPCSFCCGRLCPPPYCPLARGEYTQTSEDHMPTLCQTHNQMECSLDHEHVYARVKLGDSTTWSFLCEKHYLKKVVEIPISTHQFWPFPNDTPADAPGWSWPALKI